MTELEDAYQTYLEIRKANKYPINDRVEKRLWRKLHQFSGGDEEIMIEILDNATNGKWQDVYAITEQKNKVTDLINSINNVTRNSKYSN